MLCSLNFLMQVVTSPILPSNKADADLTYHIQIAKEYEDGPTKGVSEQNMKGTADSVPEGADPSVVADKLVELASIPRGKKPYRMTADPSDVGGEEGAAVIDRFGNEFYRRLGLEKLLKVSI